MYLNKYRLLVKKWENISKVNWKALTSLFLIFSFLFSGTAFSQTDLTSCYGSCTSNDFTIVRAFLVDMNGAELTSSACNNPDNIVQARMAFTFSNNTNSDRNGIFISGTVSGATVTGSANGYIFECFPGILPKKKTVTFIDPDHPIQWKCGTTLTLKGTFTSWGSAGEQVCSISCSEATPSKCRTVGDVIIETPLSANFSFNAKCETNKAFQTVDFSGTASGGHPPYTYAWNFGDGTTGTGQNVSHSYGSAGSFTVVLTIKDNNGTGTTKTASKSVPVTTCCTAPTLIQQPSASEVCEGTKTTFSIDFTGGVPAPTLQWQVNSGSGFTNLSNGSPYSGVDTKTLTIDPAAASLNNNQYRCVLTSGTCTAVNSDPATLTVNAYPDQPAVEITEPSVCGSATGTLKITNALSGASYTFKQDAGGNTQTLTASGAELTFTTGLVAGKKYYVTGDNKGCKSDEANCTTSSSLTKQTVANTTASNESNIETIDARILSKAKTRAAAAPNPFSSRLRFLLQSDISGSGSLELYNMLGQKVQTVFQGYVEAGKSQTIDYSVPAAQRTNLIYIFRVGDQTATGKLIGQK